MFCTDDDRKGTDITERSFSRTRTDLRDAKGYEWTVEFITGGGFRRRGELKFLGRAGVYARTKGNSARERERERDERPSSPPDGFEVVDGCPKEVAQVTLRPDSGECSREVFGT